MFIELSKNLPDVVVCHTWGIQIHWSPPSRHPEGLDQIWFEFIDCLPNAYYMPGRDLSARNTAMVLSNFCFYADVS